MFFHRPSMTSTCGPAESIATPPPESDLDDEQLRDMLASPLYLQERSKCRSITSLSLQQRKLSVKFISLPSQSRETCSSILTQEKVESRVTFRAVRGEIEALSRLSETENDARPSLEEQRDHLLAEAKSEVLKQECRTNFVDCSIREDQRQIHSSRMEIDRNNLGVKHLEESRPDSTKNWRHEKEHFEKLIFKLVTRWKN